MGPLCARELSSLVFTSPRTVRNWLLVCGEWPTYLWFFQLLSLYQGITALENIDRGGETAQNWLHCVEKHTLNQGTKYSEVEISRSVDIHTLFTQRGTENKQDFFPRQRLRKPKGMFQLGKSGFCRKNVVVKAWANWWGRLRKQRASSAPGADS